MQHYGNFRIIFTQVDGIIFSAVQLSEVTSAPGFVCLLLVVVYDSLINI